MHLEHGVFTVSLDFELYWGMRDLCSIEEYKDNLDGTRTAVREMLQVFSSHGIHATWATVGFLFFTSLDELKGNIPKSLPTYSREKLSPYKYIEEAASLDPVYHFAPDLIELIAGYEGQEIGSHTFSHYYCLEAGQSLPQLEEDLALSIKTANSRGISITSLVFPRNQCNPDYLSVLNKLGIRCYRGNEPHPMYAVSAGASYGKLRRLVLLIDTCLNLSGHNTYRLEDCIRERPFNFPASRFLRPYSRKRAILDGLRVRRIKRSMDDAARNKRIFHLWWHPHNFGANTRENMGILCTIAEHYQQLSHKYGMKSLNMGELSCLAGEAGA